jgi:hypothetical protein
VALRLQPKLRGSNFFSKSRVAARRRLAHHQMLRKNRVLFDMLGRNSEKVTAITDTLFKTAASLPKLLDFAFPTKGEMPCERASECFMICLANTLCFEVFQRFQIAYRAFLRSFAGHFRTCTTCTHLWLLRDEKVNGSAAEPSPLFGQNGI